MDFERELKHLSADELTILRYHLKRRDAQTCPSPRPFIWFLMAGRGSGKTWTAANHIFEYARQLALNLPRSPEHDIIRVACVGQNFADVQKTMIEGQSGVLSIIPDELKDPSKGFKWNRTGPDLWVPIPSANRLLYFQGFTSQKPEKIRGPQFHVAWIDEPAKLEDANLEPMGRDTTWSNLLLATRLGKEVNAPHIIITGTPTDCKLVQYLSNHEDSHVTHMTTLDNRENLPDQYIKEILSLNPNSRTYRQEVLAEILLDNPDAIFEQASIDANRAGEPPTDELDPRQSFQKVLGWDPSVSTADDGDEAGIILTGFTTEVIKRVGTKKIVEIPAEAYVLEDLSGHLSPYEQSVLILDTIFKHRVTDLVFEQNQGADQIITILTQVLKEKTQDFTIRKVAERARTLHGSIKRYQINATTESGEHHRFTVNAIHASKNKKTRAETASIKYDQGHVHHPIKGSLPVCEKEACKQSLEIQMTQWNPNVSSHRYSSPDRMDALVYTLLLIFGSGTGRNGKTLVSAPTSSKSLVSSPGRGLRSDQQITKEKKKTYASIYSRDVINTSNTGGILADGRYTIDAIIDAWGG